MTEHTKHMKFKRDSLTFNVLVFGAPSNEPVILLHGFPANAASWQPVATRLAALGFRVLAPEQRGYTISARPKRRKDYQLRELVEDVAGLLKAAKAKKAHIVGHDWGGLVAWAFASKYPEQVTSLIIVSTPHPAALAKAAWSSNQLLLSWYIAFFQLPHLPEFILKQNNGSILKRLLVKSGLDAAKADNYTASISQKGQTTAALHWYRAIPFNFGRANKVGMIKPRTLYIYGAKDNFLSEQAAKLTSNYVIGEFELLRLPQATHWIPEELPDLLADKITGFVRRPVSK